MKKYCILKKKYNLFILISLKSEVLFIKLPQKNTLACL